MNRRIIAAVASVIACGFAALVAQAQDDQTPLERLRSFLETRAETRPRINPPPLGTLPRRSDRAEVDWEAVRALLAETRRRDLAFQQRVSAASAPPPPRGLRALAPEQTPRIDRPEVLAVSMPVLAPQTPTVLASLEVYGQTDAYTATAAAADGVDLRISGARKKLVLPTRSDFRTALERRRASRPPLPGLGAQYVITRSESSTDLSFSRFGCGYVLSLICDAPDSDARCAEDAYIIELADRMALLNPEAGGQQ